MNCGANLDTTFAVKLSALHNKQLKIHGFVFVFPAIYAVKITVFNDLFPFPKTLRHHDVLPARTCV